MPRHLRIPFGECGSNLRCCPSSSGPSCFLLCLTDPFPCQPACVCSRWTFCRAKTCCMRVLTQDLCSARKCRCSAVLWCFTALHHTPKIFAPALLCSQWPASPWHGGLEAGRAREEQEMTWEQGGVERVPECPAAYSFIHCVSYCMICACGGLCTCLVAAYDRRLPCC